MDVNLEAVMQFLEIPSVILLALILQQLADIKRRLATVENRVLQESIVVDKIEEQLSTQKTDSHTE